MGTLFSTLDIARLGLQAAQVQLSVSGNNISNVNTEGYSRQTVSLSESASIKYPFGQLGTGVTVSEVRRVRDEFLDKVYRQQVAGLNKADTLATYYDQLENAFLEPTDEGFGTQINNFFDSMSDFSNNVEDLAVREATVAQAEALAESFNSIYDQLNELRTSANEEIKSMVTQINSLSQQLADLNIQIRDSELNGTTANALRDQRDLALDELAGLVDINYTTLENGQVTVRIGSDSLVDLSGANELVAETDSTLDSTRSDLLTVRFADNRKDVTVEDGELAGLLEIRDEVIPSYMGRMNEIASELIQQVNSINSQSNGLENLSGIISSTNAVSDAASALESAGLPFDVEAGSFQVAIYDGDTQISGSPFTITVDAGDTLNDLAAELNAIAPGEFTATVNGDNTLSLGVTNSTYSFTFANDTSNALVALGINGLFTGYDMNTIAVNTDIVENSQLLGSSYDLDTLATGDNSAALELAAIQDLNVLENSSSTLSGYYESTIALLGVDTQSNQVVLDTEEEFNLYYEEQRQENSGVSLDEETTYLIQYQRAYEAAARVINVADTMLDALMTIGA